MKRSRFLLSLLTALPAVTWAQTKTSRDEKGFLVKAGVGRNHGHIQLKGVNVNILDLKVSGKDTDGDIAMFEQTSLSPGRGTPLHVHLTQDEIFNIIDGVYLFRINNQTYELHAGDTIFLPRNVPHAWTQKSEKGKMNVLVQPAGKLEEFFIKMASLDTEPDQATIAKIFADHEMVIVGPPLVLNE
ncbi:MAG: cupin domain-containing protein [Flavisolibacter sp.]